MNVFDRLLPRTDLCSVITLLLSVLTPLTAFTIDQEQCAPLHPVQVLSSDRMTVAAEVDPTVSNGQYQLGILQIAKPGFLSLGSTSVSYHSPKTPIAPNLPLDTPLEERTVSIQVGSGESSTVFSVPIDNSTTLDELALAVSEKLNVQVRIENYGSEDDPNYRVDITSVRSGVSLGSLRYFLGDSLVEYGALDDSRLWQAQNLLIHLTGISPVIERSSNVVRDLIPGLTIRVKHASEKPVRLTIDRSPQRTGDYDIDLDVDRHDLAQFQSCEGLGEDDPNWLRCQCAFDGNSDDRVDSADWPIVRDLFTGSWHRVISSDPEVVSGRASRYLAGEEFSVTPIQAALNGIVSSDTAFDSVHSAIAPNIHGSDDERTIQIDIGNGDSAQRVRVVVTSSTTLADLIQAVNTGAQGAYSGAINISAIPEAPSYIWFISAKSTGFSEGDLRVLVGQGIQREGVFTNLTVRPAQAAFILLDRQPWQMQSDSNYVFEPFPGVVLRVVASSQNEVVLSVP